MIFINREFQCFFFLNICVRRKWAIILLLHCTIEKSMNRTWISVLGDKGAMDSLNIGSGIRNLWTGSGDGVHDEIYLESHFPSRKQN